MSRRGKEILIGVVVLVVLAGLAIVQFKKDSQVGVAKAQEPLPELTIGDDLDKITLKNGTKPEVTLQKEGDTWSLIEPVQATANQQACKDLVNNLKELKVDRKVDLKLDDQVKKEKHLDPDDVLHVQAWKGNDKKADIDFGNNSLMILADKPDTVYAAKGYSSWMYSKEPKDWRDKEIFKFDDSAASTVSLENKAGNFSFTKGDKGWNATLNSKAIDNLDEQKVKDLLIDMKSLKADDFGDGKTPADTGLDKPDAKIVITLKDNAGTYTLHVGKPSGNGHFAAKDGNPTIFVLTKYSTDWLLAEKSKFQKTIADAGAGAADAASMAKKDKPGNKAHPR